ncbi:hypothetical protein [Flavobacterium muglaense]|uniref:DUF4199 domain-containing protein n=1 Tax=Flavobacterium muglaense TaxID=2764716 RepID=A0A923N1D2_9FLAO|nr:hypothetical protein [Flavobacterium muglaense]MBC5839086.1 hypothetical protein [Flavobacterium muglaense]MBC5845571.1 hypothetical protein [Flavobacterium muglaense]
MKLTKELSNGILIWVGISIYFLLMKALNLADVFYLRAFNILFIYYGANRTLQSNFKEGKTNFAFNASGALVTSLIGVFISIVGLIFYSYLQGGDNYIASLSASFLFGGDPTVMTYSISLLFEGIVSAVIVSFSLMLYWKSKYPSD